MEAEKAVGEVAVALCHCGLALRHRGWHKGSKRQQALGTPAASPSHRNQKLRLLLESEIKASQEAIGKLKAMIRVNQDLLAAEQARLPSLLQCAEALDNKRLPAPEPSRPAPAIFQTTAARHVTEVVQEEAQVPNQDGIIAADFGTILKFAMTRGLKFESWDDLPRVNRKREDLNLPTYARKMAR